MKNKCFNPIQSLLVGVVSFLLLLLFPGCDGLHDYDFRLQKVDDVLSTPDISAERALSMLDTLASIPDDGLSSGAKHYKHFLSIKAADKGYKLHTSDSLYLTVKDYFLSHHKEKLPEVLYYGGRVYSDMGNYPIALQHFEEALDYLEENPEYIRLKRRTLSQMGRLLSRLGIHNDALRYVEECLKISRQLPDTLITVHNLELAGDIATRLKEYAKAQKYFLEACHLSESRYPDRYAVNRFRIGYLAYKQGNIKKSLNIIRETVNDIQGMSRSFILPVATQVYLAAGFVDTASIYAKELINSEDSLNKGIGYYVLLSDSIRNLIPIDTLSDYFRRYNEFLDNGKNRTLEEAAILQNALYNYASHDRRRQKAEGDKRHLIVVLEVLSLFMLIIVVIFIGHLLRKEKWKTRLYSTFDKIRVLKNVDSSYKGDTWVEEQRMAIRSVKKKEVLSSKEKLRDELIFLYEKSITTNEGRTIPETIGSSPVYLQLTEYVNSGTNIESREEFWIKLEEVVTNEYPEFIKRLLMLTDFKLSYQERQTALLVKCGVRLIDMTVLLGKAKGTIVSRRDSISRKIFGERKGSKIIDGIIRML